MIRNRFSLALVLAVLALATCGGYSEEEMAADQHSHESMEEWNETIARAERPRYQEPREPNPEEKFREAYNIIQAANEDRQEGKWYTEYYALAKVARLYREAAMAGLEPAVPEYHAVLDRMVASGDVPSLAREMREVEGTLLERSWPFVECAYDEVAAALQREGFDFRRDYFKPRPEDHNLFYTCPTIPRMLEDIASLAERLHRHEREWKRHLAIAKFHEECDGVSSMYSLFVAFELLYELGDNEALPLIAKNLGLRGSEESYQLLVNHGYFEDAHQAALGVYEDTIDTFLHGKGWDRDPSLYEELGRPTPAFQPAILQEAVRWAKLGGLTGNELRLNRNMDSILYELESQKRYELAEQAYRLLGDEASAQKMAILQQ